MLRPIMWKATYLGYATGEVIMYKAHRASNNEKVLIAHFRGGWRVLRTESGESWWGKFASAEQALRAAA